MVKKKQTVSEGTEVLLTNVRCVVKYGRCMGVRRYADVSNMTCRYAAARCHGGAPCVTATRKRHGGGRWDGVAGKTVKGCGRCHGGTVWQVAQWDDVAGGTVKRCGRCHGGTVWQVPRWEDVAGGKVGG